MSNAPNSTSPVCSQANCPPETKVCSTTCKHPYTCYLPVMQPNCQCPIASCVKIGFDTGADNGSSDTSSSGSSVVAPVLGSLAALGVVAMIAFFAIRRRRRRRQNELMMHGGQDDSLDSFSKRWHSTNSIDSMGKDVIQIAYIPSVIGDTPVLSPQPSMQQTGVLRPDFSSLKAEERNKHDSIQSVSSVDEAVVMAVTAKATPQVMKLNAIKATQSDLIQRSNTLHNTNKVKRSKSQRKPTEKGAHRPSPLAGQQSSGGESDSENDDDQDNPFMSDAELAMSPNNTRNSNITRTPSSYSDNPFLSMAEAKAISSFMSSPPDTPMSEATVFTSAPISVEDQEYDPLADLAGGGVKLRPWAGGSGSGPGPLRDSTFSTMSDSRSSTRGDGEEIMIFWDGHRDSRTNL